jgi:hypothetical protein
MFFSASTYQSSAGNVIGNSKMEKKAHNITYNFQIPINPYIFGSIADIFVHI